MTNPWRILKVSVWGGLSVSAVVCNQRSWAGRGKAYQGPRGSIQHSTGVSVTKKCQLTKRVQAEAFSDSDSAEIKIRKELQSSHTYAHVGPKLGFRAELLVEVVLVASESTDGFSVRMHDDARYLCHGVRFQMSSHILNEADRFSTSKISRPWRCWTSSSTLWWRLWSPCGSAVWRRVFVQLGPKVFKMEQPQYPMDANGVKVERSA